MFGSVELTIKRMIEGLKNIGGFIFGIGAFILLIFFAALVLNGAVWIGEHILSWLIKIGWILLGVNLLILLPLAFFKKTGVFGGLGIYFSSFIFGSILWFSSLLLAYSIWGFLGIIIGLFLGGVGVVPVAMLATLFNGQFLNLFVLFILLVLTFGSRGLGLHLAGRAEEKQNEILQLQEISINE